MVKNVSQKEYGMDIETLEKFMLLSQKVDKLEFTYADVADDLKTLKSVDLKECRAYCDSRFKDESQKSHDWLKILIILVITSILSTGALWYSSITRMTVVENLVIKEVDIVKKFVTKDDLITHERVLHVKPPLEQEIKR